MLVLFILFSLVSGWGGDGHRIITSLATKYMSSQNLDWLSEQIGDLMKASTWADSDEAEKQYPLSGAYHFSNTPYRKCAAFDFARDCGFGKTKGLCIVTGLSEAISRAIDPNTDPSTRADSIKFILHLMADIHQPLHTGFREDTGGLRVILGQPDSLDLHTVWDTVLINELKKQNSVPDWSGLIAPLTSRLETNNQTFAKRIQAQTNLTRILSEESQIIEYVAGIASETSLNTTCRAAYRGFDNEWIGVGDFLTPEYMGSRVPIVMVQLLKASVRLGYLLEAVGERFLARRREVRDSRREARIAKLFAHKQPVVETIDPIDGNRFSPLFIDFDPEVSEYNPCVVSASRSPVNTTKQPIESGEISDARILSDAIRAASCERASYTFDGIDLSQIVHVRRCGTILVSYKSRVADNSYRPSTVVVPVWFSGKGKPEKHVFGFDSTIFPTQMDNELVIRVILKVSGIDPRIDITDYIESIRPLSIPAPVPSYILAKLMLEHSRRQAGLVVRDTVINEIKKLGVDILFIPITKQCFVFVRLDTMKMINKDLVDPRQRFNRFLIGGKARFNIWIDPLIFDRTPESSDVFTIVKRLGMKNSAKASRFSNSRLCREIAEMEIFLASHESGIRRPDFLNGTFVDWVFDYPGDRGKTYQSIEWFRKGNLTTPQHLMDYLGIGNRTHSS